MVLFPSFFLWSLFKNLFMFLSLYCQYLTMLISCPVTMCCALLNHFSGVWLFATLWTVARQAPLSTGFSKQGYWSGLPGPPPGNLPDPVIEPISLTSPIGRWVLYQQCHLGSPLLPYPIINSYWFYFNT